MLKLDLREMKSLSRILTVFLCCVPAFSAVSGPVATTDGNNLTAYHPNNAYNNQWATMANGRYDGTTAATAKVDFGNCNAVILRCAQPKCGKGGCTDKEVAAKIVEGCVKSNNSCKKYGDDLVEFMTAQLIAYSNSKIKEQELAIEQAKAQAEAQAAAANNQSEQLAQMQNQMVQMQRQMVQQQQESSQQLQEALSQQQAQAATALENMKVAATEAAKTTESGVSAYQQDAINRGIYEEVLLRQTTVGQIETKVKDAKTSLDNMKKVLQTAFEYAGCDVRGNNCSGPKRVKKWRELAINALQPYDEAVDNIYDALMTAQIVGVDLSQIYMMLNNSCNAWGQYLCPTGTVIYPEDDASTEMPTVCEDNIFKAYQTCRDNCRFPVMFTKTYDTSTYSLPAVGINDINNFYGTSTTSPIEQQAMNSVFGSNNKIGVKTPIYSTNLSSTPSTTITYVPTDSESYKSCLKRCDSYKQGCRKCRLLKVLTGDTEVYEGWINAEETSDDQRTVISCASGALDATKLFARRTHRKSGAGLIDVEIMDRWLNQIEPDKKWKDNNNQETEPSKYCGVAGSEANTKNSLQRAILSKSVDISKLCVEAPGSTSYDATCPFISSTYAICDTHQYNNGLDANGLTESNKSDVKEIVGLKTTVISQQLYKQYEYLNATIRRLQTQLEKSVLLANLEAAGAKSEGAGSSSSSSAADKDKYIKLPGVENCWNSSTPDTRYACIQQNLNLIRSNLATNKTNAKKQLDETIKVIETDESIGTIDTKKCSNLSSNTDKIKDCINYLSLKVSDRIDARERDKNRQQLYFVGEK